MGGAPMRGPPAGDLAGCEGTATVWIGTHQRYDHGW